MIIQREHDCTLNVSWNKHHCCYGYLPVILLLFDGGLLGTVARNTKQMSEIVLLTLSLRQLKIIVL